MPSAGGGSVPVERILAAADFTEYTAMLDGQLCDLITFLAVTNVNAAHRGR